MDIKNQICSNFHKLRIYSSTTQQEVEEYFKNKLSNKEIELYAKYHTDGNQFLDFIFSKIITVDHLNKLSIHLKNILNLNLDKVLQKIRLLTNLKSLTIKITQEDGFFILGTQSIGENIKHLSQLEELILSFSCANMPINSNILVLKEAYSQIKNLRTFSINLSSFPKHCILLKNIFEGMEEQQQNLQELSICLNKIIMQEESYYIFCNELKQLKNLKMLIIQLIEIPLTIYQQNNLKNSLLELQNLEKIELSMITANQSIILSALKDLKALKKLSFFSRGYSTFAEIVKYLQEISNIKQLEEVNIFFILLVLETQQLYQLSSLLCRVPNLASLDFTFPFSQNFIQQDIVNLIGCLKVQQRLKILKIGIFSVYTNGEMEQCKLNDCISVLQNLKEFHIYFKGQINKGSICFINQIMNAINESYQLEKLETKFFMLSHKQQVPIKFGNILSKNSNLQELQIYNMSKKQNEDEEEEFTKLNNDLKKQENLQKLQLKGDGDHSKNRTICQGLSQVLPYLINLKFLQIEIKELKMSDQQEVTNFFTSIKYLSQLKKFCFEMSCSLSLNELFNIIFSNLSQMQNLASLELKLKNNNNTIQSMSQIQFPPNLNKFLFSLIQDNIQFEQVKELFIAIGKSNRLNWLSLSITFLDLTLQDLIAIENQLSRLKNLNRLILSFNHFSEIYLARLFNQLPLLKNFSINHDIYVSLFMIFIKTNINIENQLEQQNQIMNEKNCEEISQYSFDNSDLRLNFNYIHKFEDQDIEIITQIFKNFRIKHAVFNVCDQNEGKINFFQNFQFLTSLISLEILINIHSKSQDILMEQGCQLQYLKSLQNLKLLIWTYDWREGNNLFQGLRNLSNLKSLDINLQGDSLMQEQSDLNFIYSNIGSFKKLINLAISIEQYVDIQKANEHMDECIQQLPQLTSLNLKYKKYYPIQYLSNINDSLKDLYSSLKKIKSLRSLQISSFSSLLFQSRLKKIDRLMMLNFD